MENQYKKNTININNNLINLNNIFTNINKSVLLKKRLEEIRNMFKKKYNVFFMQIICLNKTNDKIIHSAENEVWHEFIWNFIQSISNFDHVITQLAQLPLGEKSIIIPNLFDNSNLRISYYILGTKIEGYSFFTLSF